MADPIGTISALAGIVTLATQVSLRLRSYERATLSQSYGGTASFFISTFFRSTASEYERLQRVIIRGSDDEALRFRDSVTNECNMTAVAVGVPPATRPDPLEVFTKNTDLRT